MNYHEKSEGEEGGRAGSGGGGDWRGVWEDLGRAHCQVDKGAWGEDQEGEGGGGGERDDRDQRPDVHSRAHEEPDRPWGHDGTNQPQQMSTTTAASTRTARGQTQKRKRRPRRAWPPCRSAEVKCPPSKFIWEPAPRSSGRGVETRWNVLCRWWSSCRRRSCVLGVQCIWCRRRVAPAWRHSNVQALCRRLQNFRTRPQSPSPIKNWIWRETK